MNKRYRFLVIIILGSFIMSCDSELERIPKDEFSIPTTFSSYENVKTYAWSFYSVFGTYKLGILEGDSTADLMVNGENNNGDPWLWQRITVPATSTTWDTPYRNIRTVNIMLDNLNNSHMNVAEIAHWRSVGYFFRSWNYFELLKKYGGVPLVLKAITTADVNILYGPRNTRDEVAQQILNDLSYAEANIRPDGDGPNTINLHVVRALMSRFGLFEGTWRKYHSLGDAETYLRASAAASQKLMVSFPTLHPKFEELFNSMDLKNVPGIILYKEYLSNQITHNLTYFTKTSRRAFFDVTKRGADQFLCVDGKTIWNSPMFAGDHNPYDEFRNRDRRMYMTITPPYEVVGRVNGDETKWDYTSNPQHREYIDLMATLTAATQKRLPESEWTGRIQPKCPNFRDSGAETGKLAWDPPYNVTATGYMLNKYYDTTKESSQGIDETDQPIFRIGEIMLNYAEAKFELGEFNQTIANATINRLRARGGVAPLTVGSEPNDPTRDVTVPATLWEIRRERAVELFAEFFRFDDLRRWKKMDYATKQKLGRYIVAADYNNKIPVLGGASEGYISRIGVPPAFPEYYYLYPIPSNNIVLNPRLEQNPNW